MHEQQQEGQNVGVAQILLPPLLRKRPHKNVFPISICSPLPPQHAVLVI